MPKVQSWIALALLVLLPSCGGGSGSADVPTAAVDDTTGATQAKTASVSRLKPLDAYVILGGDIKRCWFNANKPLLPDYVYRADVPADGSKGLIPIHDRANLGRAGMSTYAIDFKQDGVSTIVTTENRKMPPEIAERMQADINRWKLGDATCSGGWPKVTAAAKPEQAAVPRWCRTLTQRIAVTSVRQRWKAPLFPPRALTLLAG